MNFYYYKITNIENGSFYIGITTNIEERKKSHFGNLKNHIHPNYKMQKDYDLYGPTVFKFEIIDCFMGSVKEAYQHEYDLIQKFEATKYYNILEGGLLNPVYSPQVVEKLKQTHQAKYDNILQYTFDGKGFTLIETFPGIREACRKTGCDFRAVQNCTKSTQSHHGNYWVKESEKEIWLEKFLKRHTCCVAKLDEETGQIEDSALTIKEFAQKYNTTYNRIYHSLVRGDRTERKYKFIRITANKFAELNNLSL